VEGKDLKKAKAKRILALVMAAVILCIISLSAAFVITHIHHACTGEDCPVCAEIQAIALTQYTIGAALVAVGIVASVYGIADEAICVPAFCANHTLITIRKVKLNI
jgi:hypothetical protein